MFNKLKNMAAAAATKGESLFNKTINRALFERIVSAGYLIASADGDFDADERAALVRLINRDLPDFTIDDILRVLSRCDEKVSFDKTLGTQEIIDEIGKAHTDDSDARQIMSVCGFIGAADGTYDNDEKLVARSICYALKLAPAQYGLQ